MALEIIQEANRCQISEMEKSCNALDPSHPESCKVFTLHVTAIHALILHTYQVTAYAALKEPDADKAANLWKQFLEICDLAIRGLKVAKEKFPHCGTPDLYDLALDYRCAAAERYRQNSQDAECAQKVLPKGLFPSKS